LLQIKPKIKVRTELLPGLSAIKANISIITSLITPHVLRLRKQNKLPESAREISSKYYNVRGTFELLSEQIGSKERLFMLKQSVLGRKSPKMSGHSRPT